MEAWIGVFGLVLVASIGGTMAFFRRRRTSRAEVKATVDSKLDTLTTTVNQLVIVVTETRTWGKANSDGIRRLTERFDRYMDK